MRRAIGDILICLSFGIHGIDREEPGEAGREGRMVGRWEVGKDRGMEYIDEETR